MRGRKKEKKTLLKREKAVALRRQGLTYEEIGKALGVCRERVRQLLNESPVKPTFSLICHSCGKPFISNLPKVKYCPECRKTNRRRRRMRRCVLCKRWLPFQEMVSDPAGSATQLCKNCALKILFLAKTDMQRALTEAIDSLRERIDKGYGSKIFAVYLTKSKDHDLLEYLENQPQGQRSTAFKKLVRQALNEKLGQEQDAKEGNG